MKVYIGLPSYNEDDSIAFVTKQIDKGLSLLAEKYPETEALIINIDNSKNTNTKNAFIQTKTRWEKVYINNNKATGKGGNLIRFFSYSKSADILLTIDSDLTSITPKWILKLAEPLIKKEADFVTPLYERSRFEGSTTNHFAYPILYGYFAYDIRQPIGGDFGLNQKFVNIILKEQISKQVKKYGIDIFLSINAALNQLKVEQVKLGQKIHKPSFSKMHEMFPQIASAALDLIKKYPPTKKKNKKVYINTCITRDKTFKHEIWANNIVIKAKQDLKTNLINNQIWLKNHYKTIKNIIENDNTKINPNIWTDILINWITYYKDNPHIDSFVFASQLLPFFVMRAAGYWKNVKNSTPQTIEDEIKEQAKLFNLKLLNYYN